MLTVAALRPLAYLSWCAAAGPLVSLTGTSSPASASLSKIFGEGLRHFDDARRRRLGEEVPRGVHVDGAFGGLVRRARGAEGEEEDRLFSFMVVR